MPTTNFSSKVLYGLRGEGTRGIPEIPAGASSETKFVIEVTIDDTDSSGNRDFQFYSQGDRDWETI